MKYHVTIAWRKTQGRPPNASAWPTIWWTGAEVEVLRSRYSLTTEPRERGRQRPVRAITDPKQERNEGGDTASVSGGTKDRPGEAVS